MFSLFPAVGGVAIDLLLRSKTEFDFTLYPFIRLKQLFEKDFIAGGVFINL